MTFENEGINTQKGEQPPDYSAELLNFIHKLPSYWGAFLLRILQRFAKSSNVSESVQNATDLSQAASIEGLSKKAPKALVDFCKITVNQRCSLFALDYFFRTQITGEGLDDAFFYRCKSIFPSHTNIQIKATLHTTAQRLSGPSVDTIERMYKMFSDAISKIIDLVKQHHQLASASTMTIEDPECVETLKTACNSYQEGYLAHRYNPAALGQYINVLGDALSTCAEWLDQVKVVTLDENATKDHLHLVFTEAKRFIDRFENAQFDLLRENRLPMASTPRC